MKAFWRRCRRRVPVQLRERVVRGLGTRRDSVSSIPLYRVVALKCILGVLQIGLRGERL